MNDNGHILIVDDQQEICDLVAGISVRRGLPGLDRA